MSVYRVEGSGELYQRAGAPPVKDSRHLLVTCRALRAEVLALHPEIGDDVSKLDAACEMTRKSNTAKLRDATKRCERGCWKEYARDERASALTGSRAHGKDAAWNAASNALHASARDRAALKRAAAKLDEAARAELQQRVDAGSARVKRATS